MSTLDNPLIMIDKNTLQGELRSGRNLVLITENLSGHRVQWLNVLASRLLSSETNLLVLSLANFSKVVGLCVPEKRLKMCSDFNSKMELVVFLKQHLGTNQCITWDGDNWIIQLLMHRLKCRILIMRPYLDWTNFLSMVKTSFKLLLCYLTNLFPRFEIALLGIPFCNRYNFLFHLVDDEVQVIPKKDKKISFETLKHQNSNFKVVLPGFVTVRKNPLLAIFAVERARLLTGKSIELHFLGTLSSESGLNSEIISRSWIFVHDYYIERKVFLDSIESADLVMLPYSNIASSSIALESMSLGVRVLMAEGQCWKNLEKNNPEIFFMAPLNLLSYSDAIVDIVSREDLVIESYPFRYRSRQLALDYLIGRSG